MSKNPGELREAMAEASRKVTEAAQEAVGQSLPAIREQAELLSKQVGASARKFAAEQGPVLREAYSRAVEEFRKAFEEASKKGS